MSLQDHIEEIKQDRLTNGTSYRDLAKRFYTSEAGMAKFFKRHITFTQEEEDQVRSLSHSYHAAKLGAANRSRYSVNYNESLQVIHDLKRQIADLSTPQRAPISDDIPSFKRGVLAEYFVKYALLRAGLTIFEPPILSEALDVLVQGPSGKFYKCEVKATTRSMVSLSRTKFRLHGGYEMQRYSEADKVDMFILVDLTHERLFIVPYSESVSQGRQLTLTINGWAWKWKDRFDLFR